MRHGPYAVLEGPDGTGKTTLAEYMAAQHGFTYAHCGPPETDAVDFYLDRLRENEGPVVSDRLHVGSWVYGTAFRNGPDMTDYEEWALEGYLLARGTVLVYCIVARDVVEQNLVRGPDNEDARTYEAPEKRELLRKLYDEYMRRTALLVVRYSYTDGDMEDVARTVVDILQSDESLRPRFEAGMIGNSTTPTLVLVGEQPNGRPQTINRFRPLGDRVMRRALRMIARIHDRGGAFSRGPAGRYLFQTLRAAGLGLYDVCILNAVQWDGRTISDLVEEDDGWFKRITDAGAEVVALGRVAARELERAGISYREAPHPSYVRRFFYKRVLDYGRVITGETPYVAKEWCHGGV